MYIIWKKIYTFCNSIIVGVGLVLGTLTSKVLDFFGVKDKGIFFLHFSVCLLFSLVPFRILIFFGVPLFYRLCFGLFFASIVFSKSSKLVPYLLSNKLLQLFFYYSLCVDDFFKSLFLPIRLLFFFFFFSLFVYILFYSSQAFFFCLFCLFSLSFYQALKKNFVNRSSPYCFVAISLTNPNQDFFTWLDVLENMGIVSYALFKTPIVNRLDLNFYKAQFRFVLLPFFIN